MFRRIAWLAALTTAALVAALACALFAQESRIRVPAITALITLVAPLLSYLGGVGAGAALRDEGAPEGARTLALAMSFVVALAGWGVLWLPTPRWQLAAAIATLAFVVLADRALAHTRLLPPWVATLRASLAALLCAGLALGWALS
jgi:hypothetical protein